MTTHSFLTRARTFVLEPIQNRPFVSADALEETANLDSCAPETKTVLSRDAERFISRLGAVAILFLLLVFSVFREIQHNREMYRMSRMVAAAEAQSRQWQEQLRNEQAREAGLIAELQARPLLTRSAPFSRTDFSLPN